MIVAAVTTMSNALISSRHSHIRARHGTLHVLAHIDHIRRTDVPAHAAHGTDERAQDGYGHTSTAVGTHAQQVLAGYPGLSCKTRRAGALARHTAIDSRLEPIPVRRQGDLVTVHSAIDRVFVANVDEILRSYPQPRDLSRSADQNRESARSRRPSARAISRQLPHWNSGLQGPFCRSNSVLAPKVFELCRVMNWFSASHDWTTFFVAFMLSMGPDGSRRGVLPVGSRCRRRNSVRETGRDFVRSASERRRLTPNP
jgi:hypothetical protein